MAWSTIGTSYWEPKTLNPNDRTRHSVTYVQGWTCQSADGHDADITLGSLGAPSGSSDFYLTKLVVGIREFTVTAAYNVLYGGDTIATLGPDGCDLTFEPGLKILAATYTSTSAFLQLVVSCGTATNTAFSMLAQGYYFDGAR